MDDNEVVIEWHAHGGHPDFRHFGDGAVFRHDSRTRFVFSTDTNAGWRPQFELLGEYVFSYHDTVPLFVIRGDDVYAYEGELADIGDQQPWYTLRKAPDRQVHGRK